MEGLSFKTFEVLDVDTHKYTSTSVSGGGTNIHTGRVDPVSSSTTHHSIQKLWLKNILTGAERDFTFSTGNNISARPGHKLILAWDTDGKFVASKNISVENGMPEFGDTWYSRNVSDFAFSTKGTRIKEAALWGVLLGLPYFGTFMAVYFVLHFGFKRLTSKKWLLGDYMKIGFIAAALHVVFYFMLDFKHNILVMAVMATAIGIMLFKQEMNDKKQWMDKIDALWVAMHVEAEKVNAALLAETAKQKTAAGGGLILES